MIAAFSISPGGTGESVGDVVGECVAIVRDSGLPNETNAMFTNVEGSWEQISAVIGACIDHVAQVAPRVGVVIKVDHRPGVADAMAHKNERIAGFEDPTGEA